MLIQVFPMIAVGVFGILCALRFKALYPNNAGKAGFGPSQIAGAIGMFIMGVGFLVWSFLAIVGIAPTQ